MEHLYNPKKLKLAKKIDKFLSFFIRSAKPEIKHDEINKILIVQSHLIGDLIMLTPMLESLRRFYPNAKITLLANSFAQSLFKTNRLIDHIEVIRFPWSLYDYSLENLLSILKKIFFLKKQKFDLGIDAQIDMRNKFLLYLVKAKIRLGHSMTGGNNFLTHIEEKSLIDKGILENRLNILNQLNVPNISFQTILEVEEKSLQWAEQFFINKKINPKETILIHPGASEVERHWGVKKFTQIYQKLNNNGHQVVFVQGPLEKELIQELKKNSPDMVILETNLQNFFAIMKMVRLFIGLDSSGAHIAGALQTESIILYGPKSPQDTKPPYPYIHSIWQPAQSNPSTWIHNISVEMVLKQVERVLN